MFFDLIFILLATFCLSFAWARYYIKSNLVCLFLAIIATILCFFAIKRLFFSKKHKKILKNQEQKETEIVANYLSFLPQKQVTNLFLQLPQIDKQNAKTNKNVITINQDDVTKKLIFVFENSPLTKSDFCKIIKENTADVVEIFATDFAKDLSQIANKCPCKTKFFNKTQVYFLLKNNNLLPDVKKENSKLHKSGYHRLGIK